MAYSLAIHVIGIVFWLGGLLVLTRLFKQLVLTGGLPDSARLETAKIIKRSYMGFVMPGIVLALGSGIYQLLERGMGFYMAQGWFHGKLTLVLVLLVASFVFGAQVTGATNGKPVKAGVVGMIHGLTSAGLVLISFMTLVGRA